MTEGAAAEGLSTSVHSPLSVTQGASVRPMTPPATCLRARKSASLTDEGVVNVRSQPFFGRGRGYARRDGCARATRAVAH